MYEPSHFMVEDRDALRAVMRAHPLAILVTAGEAHKPSVLNGLNANSESGSQVMAQLVKTHALGGTA